MQSHDGAQHLGVIIHHQEDRFRYSFSLFAYLMRHIVV